MSIPVMLGWLISSHKSQLLPFQEFCESVDITLVIWIQWSVQFSCSAVSDSFNDIISIQWYQEYLLLESGTKYKAGLNWGEEYREKEMLNTYQHVLVILSLKAVAYLSFSLCPELLAHSLCILALNKYLLNKWMNSYINRQVNEQMNKCHMVSR